jgi:hypothetical protein
MPGLVPGISANISPTGMVGLGGIVALLALAAWLGIRAWKRSRISPEELERRRRAALHAQGKMGDATLIEARGDLLFYSYDVRGVEYTASQDISALRSLLPTDPAAVNGVVYVKYDPRNPANSIILAEEWSGLPNLKQKIANA